ncbi:hypothetical protein LCGC14_0801530 [marine sediment metagenome]|uniref:Uncharacterized protein n=1 Tax=marine sediment metagenome TaxID=412755 RepID=A0A0F9PPE7_9ZZZZ
MIEDITEQTSLVDTIKGVLSSELENFTRNYIKDHVYITLRAISYKYIDTYHSVPLMRYEKNKLIKILNMKLGRIFTKLCIEDIMEQFNRKTYKRI